MSSNPIVLIHLKNNTPVHISTDFIQQTPNTSYWEARTSQSIGLTLYCYAEFLDGGRLEIQAFRCTEEGTSNSFVCTIRSFSSMVCEYIYNLAIASEMIIFPSDPFATILVSESQRAHLEETWEEKYGDPVFCPSAEALEPLLAEGFFAWLNYRNRVIPEQEE